MSYEDMFKGLNKDVEEATWAGRRTVYIQAIIDAKAIVEEAIKDGACFEAAFKVVLETLLLERFSQETMAESREHIGNIAKMLNDMH